MRTLYPLKFQPILKDKIWGGQKLQQLLHKSTSSTKAGESWEISDVEGDTSIVANGPLKGTSLKTLMDTYTSCFAKAILKTSRSSQCITNENFKRLFTRS